jgi:hypothetical protein
LGNLSGQKWVNYHLSMNIPQWLPITISGVGTIISLSAFAYQVHRARFNQSVDLLFRLEADFFGSSKREQRAKAAKGMEKGDAVEAEPILDFFETMGLLLRRKALDAEMVAHTFFYWIDHYYTALEPYIRERQRRDPLVWKDLQVMVKTLRAHEESLLGRPVSTISPEQVANFLTEEQS